MATNQNRSAVSGRTSGPVAESLDGTTALVVGSGSRLKHTLLRAFIGGGARVVVTNDDTLPNGYDSSELLVTDHVLDGSRIERARTAERLRDEVRDRVGALDAVVAVSDAVWSGDPLLETTTKTWHTTLGTELVAPFVLARTFIPLLPASSDESSYTFINHPMGEIPMPYAGASAVAAAGRRMAAQLVMQETATDTGSVRVNEITPYLPEASASSSRHGLETITRRDVARVTAALVDPSSDARGELIRLREPADIEAWTADELQ